ncbi:MAG: alpha/beta fold hydrolase, partial [Vicinamibacteraceae bacterium]|nr:alpha/beta fold hydrolase [Vicinamibacteraceae bacterium]
MSALPRIVALLTLSLGPAAFAAAAVPEPAQTSGRSAAGQPAPAAGPTASPAQDAAFRVIVRGIPLGTEQITVLQEPDGWFIIGSSRLEQPLDLTIRRAEIRYDAQWRPRAVSVDGSFRAQKIDFKTRFEGETAQSSVLHQGQMVTKQDAVSADTVALPNNVYASYAALAVRLARLEKGATVPVYIAPQAQTTATVDEVEVTRFQTVGRSFDGRRTRVLVANPAATVAIDVWAEVGSARLMRVAIPAAALDVIREDLASVAARETRTARDNDEDVRIPGNGFSIAGTVSKPKDGTVPARLRLPAIVLVGGSGPVDRDELVAGIPIFGQLAGALADAGHLVLRYDKRGVGQSGGREESATLSDYADDLRAAVRWLEKRRDVDPKRITAVGHSEGALVAMLAATREKKITRLVLMAGPGTTGADLVLEQQRHLLAQSKDTEAARQEKIALQQRIQKAVLSGEGWEGVPDELRKAADTPWFASFLGFDPSKVMSKVKTPVLVVSAALDTQVPPHHGEKLLALARARKNAPPSDLVTLEGVNHLFVPATTGEVSEYASLTARQITPDLAKTIVDWLGKT